ncbi:MAG: hypothetical protein HY040_12635 [Planctomycetes bacterium]|nr:hypothetical protein [Planctomycetota bacterium]
METQPSRKGRDTVMSLGLGLALFGVLFFFLNLVSLGLVFQVSAAILVIVIVGYGHYLLWGHSMSQEVAAEREMEKLKEAMEAEREQPYDDRIRRYREDY